jgi:AcrR family transcriptional regulator
MKSAKMSREQAGQARTALSCPYRRSSKRPENVPMSTPSPERAALRRQPNSAKSQQRVRDILRIGRDVLAEKGYERATTTEIAQRLAISEATVFSYFASKRELCVMIISDWYDEIIAEVAGNLPLHAPLREQFEFIVHSHLRLFLHHGTGLCALVLSEGRSQGQQFGDTLLKLQRRYTQPLMDLLARGQASGQVRSDLPLRLLRSMVFGPMEHVLWDAVLADHPYAIEATARQLSDVLWSALTPSEVDVAALVQFRHEVEQASQRLRHAESRPDMVAPQRA